MDFLGWLRFALGGFFDLIPVETALVLGLILFALSWITPRRLLSLPSSGRRVRVLLWAGIAGPIALVAVATVTSWLAATDPITRSGGWWQRPAPLLAAALVVSITALALRAEPLPAPGERAISPRRRWWAFAPRPLLWTTLAVAVALLLTSAWQTAVGVALPAEAKRYGVGPEATGLPEFMSMQGGMGYVWGAGWPNHLATLLALAAATIALILSLGADANRPVFARITAPEVRAERSATARVLVLIALGGALLTLGAVWAHVGFIGEIKVGLEPDAEGQPSVIIGTGYRDIASLMHRGGYLVQGLGAALMLRLAVDTVRALRAPAPAADTAVSTAGGVR